MVNFYSYVTNYKRVKKRWTQLDFFSQESNQPGCQFPLDSLYRVFLLSSAWIHFFSRKATWFWWKTRFWKHGLRHFGTLTFYVKNMLWADFLRTIEPPKASKYVQGLKKGEMSTTPTWVVSFFRQLFGYVEVCSGSWFFRHYSMCLQVTVPIIL